MMKSLKWNFSVCDLPMSARLGRFCDKARHDILLVQSLIFFVVASACALSQPADPDGTPPQTTASPPVPLLWPATNAEPAISDQNSVPTSKAEAVSREIVPSRPLDEVKTYLWGVYQRSSTKIDGNGDFTWKDIVAADVWGLSMEDYVVGGMDADFRELLFAAGRAMDMAGINWTILSGFRDDFRQALASGLRARGGNSFHGGSVATGGYGHGCAVDLASSDGLSDDKLWSWLDRHSQQFGLHRPLPGADPAHVQPIAGWRQLAEKLRDERRAAASDSDRGSVAATEPDSIVSRVANSFLLSEEQFTCSRGPVFASTNKVHNPTHPIRTSHSKEHQINRREKTARDHTHPASSGRNAQIKGRGSRSRRAGESLAGASFATLPTASAVSPN